MHRTLGSHLLSQRLTRRMRQRLYGNIELNRIEISLGLMTHDDRDFSK